MDPSTEIDPETREEIEDLPEADPYEPPVASIMSRAYADVELGTTAAEALEQFREESPDDDRKSTVYYVYVVDEDDHLEGVASVRQLIEADDDTPVEEIMASDPVSIDADVDVEEAAARIHELHFFAVPVTEDDHLVGVVRMDDLVELLEEEATTDMFKLAGLDISGIEEHRSRMMLDASISKILRVRVPWLVVALVGGFLAGGVIGQFEDTLEGIIVLAFFIPVIMDMGGNVGTQSSTIFIRGVVLGHIDRANLLARLGKEVFIGTLIGLIIGVLAGGVAYLWVGAEHPEIFLVVLGAMVGTCIVASLVGYVIPWIMHVIGQDPAAASNPIVTTIKDVSGLLIYFALAALLFDIAEDVELASMDASMVLLELLAVLPVLG